jgi:RNA polymerase sigma factor for flagellar operon FliA
MSSLTTATATAVSISSVTGEPGSPDVGINPEDATARAEMRKMVRDAMSALDADELRVVKMHYFEEKSLREAARELKVTQSWARRLHARAMVRLTKHMYP